MTRDDIASAMLMQAQAGRRQPQLRRPFAPAPVMGTPVPRPQEQSPYGFQSGFVAAGGNAPAPYDPRARPDSGWSDIYAKLFGADLSGSAAP